MTLAEATVIPYNDHNVDDDDADDVGADDGDDGHSDEGEMQVDDLGSSQVSMSHLYNCP